MNASILNRWANRKDSQGRTVFSGGCLGLNDIGMDENCNNQGKTSFININPGPGIIIVGLVDQSKPLPSGGKIEQAEGVVWMAFFCSMMLDISLELASTNPQTYETLASQFLDHFISLCDTINSAGGNGNGLWNEEQGFYYDRIRLEHLASEMYFRCLSESLCLNNSGTLKPALLWVLVS